MEGLCVMKLMGWFMLGLRDGLFQGLIKNGDEEEVMVDAGFA
jgi:hypothetical protein